VETRLDLLLLAVLARGPRHGYGVLEELRRRDDSTPESLVHPALQRLERAGLVTSRRGRERVYRLAPRGRGRLERERRMWLGLARALAASF
jgi:DNA-binding PadR family transcriptional regulator